MSESHQPTEPRAKGDPLRLDAVAHLTPVFASAFAVLYGAGFLVISTYLGSFGVRNVEPLRARYIAAGVVFTLLASVAAYTGVRIADKFMEFEHKRGWRRFISAASLPAASVGVTFITLMLLTGLRARGSALYQADWEYALNVGWFAMGAMMSALIARNRRHDWHTWFGGLIIIGSVGTLILALVTYATTIYPSLPTWLGGGRPELVQVITSDMSVICPPCGAGQLRLIDDDGTRLILLIDRDDGRQVAVEIARSEVRSVIHAPVPTPATFR